MSVGLTQGNAASITVISVTIDPASVAANTSAAQTFTVPGVRIGDHVLVSKPSLTAGLMVGHARVSAVDTVSVVFGNLTGSPIDPAAEAYLFTVIRPEGGAAASAVIA